MLISLSLLWCSDLIPLWDTEFGFACLCLYVYPTVKALAVGAGSSEVDIRVLADLVDGLGLTGHALQIHHGNMATLDEHLSHTHTHINTYMLCVTVSSRRWSLRLESRHNHLKTWNANIYWSTCSTSFFLYDTLAFTLICPAPQCMCHASECLDRKQLLSSDFQLLLYSTRAVLIGGAQKNLCCIFQGSVCFVGSSLLFMVSELLINERETKQKISCEKRNAENLRSGAVITGRGWLLSLQWIMWVMSMKWVQRDISSAKRSGETCWNIMNWRQSKSFHIYSRQTGSMYTNNTCTWWTNYYY